MALAERLARGRIYYGWYIGGALFISSFVTSVLNAFAPGVFLKPMTEELGWSRSFFSAVVWLSTIISSPLAMVLWPMVDKRGARGVMLVSGLAVGVGTVALSLVQAPWHFILIKSIIIPLGTTGLGPMMAMMVVSNWFVKRRGRALALTAMGMSAGGVVAPTLVTYLISSLGWRQAWVALGLAALAITVLPTALLIKRRPEDLGLLPDGGPGGDRPVPKEAPPPAPEAKWTRREVLRTPSFWLMSLAHPLGFLGHGVVSQHLMAYLTDPEIGFHRQKAALIWTTVSIASLVSKVPWGFLLERVPVRYCYVIAFLFYTLSMILLGVGGANLAFLLLAAAAAGIGWGGNLPLQGMIYANYFGRTSQGMARSLATPIQSFSGPLGPILAGLVWDITGTYRSIFAFYAIPSVMAIPLIMLARPPVKTGAKKA